MTKNLLASFASTILMSVAATESSNVGAGSAESDNGAAPEADTNAKLESTRISEKATIAAIHKALGGQRVRFATIEEAAARLQEASAKTNAFGGLPTLAYDTEKKPIDADLFNWYIATVTKRLKESNVNALEAIICFPMPKTERFIEEQAEYVAKQIEKENADIIYSQGIRAATTPDDLQNVLDGIPLTTDEFVNNQSSAMDTSVFDEIWPDFRAGFIKAKPAFEKAIPQKQYVLKAFRSKSFAEANPFTETLALKKDTLADGTVVDGWDRLLGMLIKAASTAKDQKTGEPKNYDLSTLESWRDTRATVKLAYNVAPQDVDVNTLDFN